MTMAAAAQAGPPEINYFGLIEDQKTQEKVIEEAAATHRMLFEVELEAARAALGLPEQPPQQRLTKYTSRTPATWAAYQQQRPDLHAKQIADFERLVQQQINRQSSRGVVAGLAGPLS